MDFDRILDNHSYARAGSSPMLDAEGRDVLVVVAKVGYAVDPRGKVLLDPTPVRFVDDADEGGGLLRPNDLADEKPGTDVGLVGTAHPQGGVKPRSLVWLDVAGQKHAVQIVGERTYVLRRGEIEASAPTPVQPTPLRWDLAFGGVDESDPEHPVAHPENPVGRGWARDRVSLAGKPAPQIVDAGGAEDVLVGLAPIPPHWEPRLGRFGTMDDAWGKTRAPVWPRDAKPERWCWSAPGLHRPTPLRPDVAIEVGGVRPEGIWRFQLPDYAVAFGWVLDGEQQQHTPHLDGLLVDADAGKVELTWRVSIRLPRKWQRLSRISVHSVGEMPDAVLGIAGPRLDVA